MYQPVNYIHVYTVYTVYSSLVSTGLSTARVFIRQFNLFKVDEISYNWLLLCIKMQTDWLSRQQDKRNNGTNILYFEMRFSFEVLKRKVLKKNMVSFPFATN